MNLLQAVVDQENDKESKLKLDSNQVIYHEQMKDQTQKNIYHFYQHLTTYPTVRKGILFKIRYFVTEKMKNDYQEEEKQKERRPPQFSHNHRKFYKSEEARVQKVSRQYGVQNKYLIKSEIGNEKYMKAFPYECKEQLIEYYEKELQNLDIYLSRTADRLRKMYRPLFHQQQFQILKVLKTQINFEERIDIMQGEKISMQINLKYLTEKQFKEKYKKLIDNIDERINTINGYLQEEVNRRNHLQKKLKKYQSKVSIQEQILFFIYKMALNYQRKIKQMKSKKPQCKMKEKYASRMHGKLPQSFLVCYQRQRYKSEEGRMQKGSWQAKAYQKHKSKSDKFQWNTNIFIGSSQNKQLNNYQYQLHKAEKQLQRVTTNLRICHLQFQQLRSFKQKLCIISLQYQKLLHKLKIQQFQIEKRIETIQQSKKLQQEYLLKKKKQKIQRVNNYRQETDCNIRRLDSRCIFYRGQVITCQKQKENALREITYYEKMIEQNIINPTVRPQEKKKMLQGWESD